MLGLVVSGDSNINPVGGRVSVAKSDDGDVHVRGLLDGLMVKTGVANNDEAGLHELLGVVIGKGTGNPLSTEVLGTSVGSELEDSTLGEGTLGNNLSKRWVSLIILLIKGFLFDALKVCNKDRLCSTPNIPMIQKSPSKD